ncbi:type 1 periplasmic-binding domain-containing protein [Streptomyces mirabilis]|uniref:hypothetical protein n=1 Tax=Streptomyces mirabilis TaxID=68239 RepID=UPI0036DAC3C0
MAVAHWFWCDELGMPALVEQYASLPDYFTAEQNVVSRLLHRDPRADAVIGVYSDSGHNILAAARHHGLRVPRSRGATEEQHTVTPAGLRRRRSCPAEPGEPGQ